MDDVHIRLKASLFKAGVAQMDVAEILDMDPALFSRILRGLRPMPDGFEERVLAAIDLLEKAEQAADKERQRVLAGTEAD